MAALRYLNFSTNTVNYMKMCFYKLHFDAFSDHFVKWRKGKLEV